MQLQQYQFNFEVYDSVDELNDDDKHLLQQAKKIALQAYAPYSQFLVGAAALLSNGKMITGTNQENASYPVGTCAERVLLGVASSLFPEEHIITLAISYHHVNGSSAVPLSPCGMCRQALIEHETRYGHHIRLILGGESGKVYIIPRSSSLLPLQFTDEFLK